MNNKQVINSRPLANAIKFLLGISYEEVPHKTDERRSVYVFNDSYELQKALDGLMKLRQEVRK